MSFTKKISKGFTLIELMIVVAIIGILAAIAIPAYQDYVGKSQASEGVTLLSALKSPIAEYYTRNGHYPDLVTSGQLDGIIKTGKYVQNLQYDGGTMYFITFKAVGINSKLAGKTMAIGYNQVTGDFDYDCQFIPTGVKPSLCRN